MLLVHLLKLFVCVVCVFACPLGCLLAFVCVVLLRGGLDCSRLFVLFCCVVVEIAVFGCLYVVALLVSLLCAGLFYCGVLCLVARLGCLRVCLFDRFVVVWLVLRCFVSCGWFCLCVRLCV